MASLLAKDAYLQSLARKICSRPSPEPQKRKSGKALPWAATGGLRKGPPHSLTLRVYPTLHPEEPRGGRDTWVLATSI